jgi:3D (Asp-Asp-Asp) domain-containing protein
MLNTKGLLVAIMVTVGVVGAEAKKYTVTAYCACVKCCGGWSGLNETASGKRPREGITVAAPRSMKFGTKLQIQGMGTFTVQDRLHRRYDNRIDIFIANHDRAKAFGKRKLSVKKIS